MQLGIGSYTYGWSVAAGVKDPSLEYCIDANALLGIAKANDVPVVQLAENLSADTFSETNIERIRGAATRIGVRLELATRGSDPNHLVRTLRLAAKAGSPILRVVADSQGDEPDRDDLARRIEQAMPTCQETNVCLALENHDRFTIADYRSLLARFDAAWLGICLDTANCYGALEGFRETVAGLADRTVNLHLKDVRARRFPHQQGFLIEGCAAGRGRIDLSWVAQQVSRYDLCRTAILEQWLVPSEDMADTCREEQVRAYEGINYLKRLLSSPNTQPKQYQ